MKHIIEPHAGSVLVGAGGRVCLQGVCLVGAGGGGESHTE